MRFLSGRKKILLEISLSIIVLLSSSSLINALPTRGQPNDLWADLVIGQPNFTEDTPYDIVNDRAFLTNGLTVDRSVTPGRLYVYDGGNSRILGLGLETCYATPSSSRCQAQIVIGQPDFNSSACNGDSNFQNYPQRATASANTLCGIPEETNSVGESGAGASLAVDNSGNLFVPDYGNSRIVKYNNPFNTDTIADEVWGQNDFSGNNCNKGQNSPDATTLCFQGFSEYWLAGVDVDPQGNVWVADTYNNRVVRYPKDPDTGIVSKTADLVLGQPNFTTRNAGPALNQMYAPGAVRVSPTTGKVYVAEFQNYRITVFSAPFTNGMTGESFGSNFHRPSGIDFDPSGQGIWINDTGSSMLELWDEQTQTVKKVLGKDVYTPNGNQNQLLYDNFGSIGIDTEGNVLTALRGSDILRFSAPIPDPTPGIVYQPDKYLFSPPYGSNSMNASGMDSARGVTVSDNQFIVQDTGRLLFWNDPTTLNNGKPADGVVEVSDFISKDGRLMSRIKADTNHHLWVLAKPGGDYPSEIWVYQLPLTTGALPLKKIGFPMSVLGNSNKIQSVGNFEVAGIAPVGNGTYVWVSDPDKHRVLRIRNPLTQPVIDVILGQNTLTGSLCNQGSVKTNKTMCYPGAVALDRLGNLYVSDHTLEINGNMRLLEFDTSVFNNITDVALIDPAATRIFNGIAGFEPVFDSNNRMVIGLNRYYNHNFPSDSAFPVIFNNLLSYPKGSVVSPVPDGNLQDFYSMAYSSIFDQNDNLYMTDINRSRVLIYNHPLSVITPTPTPTSTPTPTPTPTPVSCQAPTIISHSDTNSSRGGTVSFAWNPVSGASNYRIQRQNSSGGSWSTQTTTSSATYTGSDASNDPNWRVFVYTGSCRPTPGPTTTFDP